MRGFFSKYYWIGAFIVVGFMLISCSGAAPDKDISGNWKSDDGDMTLSINLNGEQKTIQREGKMMPVTSAEKTNENVVKLNVKEDEGIISSWTFQKMWNDNGSDFILILSLPDGSRERLLREEPS